MSGENEPTESELRELLDSNKVYKATIVETMVFSRPLSDQPSRLARIIGQFVPTWIKSRIPWFTDTEQSKVFKYFADRYGIRTNEKP